MTGMVQWRLSLQQDGKQASQKTVNIGGPIIIPIDLRLERIEMHILLIHWYWLEIKDLTNWLNVIIQRLLCSLLLIDKRSFSIAWDPDC
jgi:hypothetical protein